MKKFLLILSLFLCSSFSLLAQEEEDMNEGIPEKMNEYIQKRLSLSREESARFSPVFQNYYREWRETLKQHKGDPLVRQQKVAELRIRYRDQFKKQLGEKRANEVFQQQESFIRELRNLRRDRMRRNR